MCDRGKTLVQGELRNNNPQDGLQVDDDANANEISVDDGRGTLDTSRVTETIENEKAIIWGADSQSDDPELAEFEMLECQELEEYLVEEGEDFVGLLERKDLQGQFTSRVKPKDSGTSPGKEERRSDVSSGTDGFVTCSSTFASMATALDTVGRSTISEDLDLASQTCNTISERGNTTQRNQPSNTRTVHPKNVDMNCNSKIHSPKAQVSSGVAPCSDHFSNKHRKNNNPGDEAGNPVSNGNTEHKSTPAVKQPHGESGMKIDKGTQADENPSPVYSPSKTGIRRTRSSIEPKVFNKPFESTMKKQKSFDRSYRKQPSFENSPKKQNSFENGLITRSSSLDRRKPWVSPSRTVTTSPPKSNTASPKRQGSPAKGQTTRAQSLDSATSPKKVAPQTAKLKTSLSSGIPKPIIPYQKEPEVRHSSPPPKPKNVRPKIITYVRKNPQAAALSEPLTHSKQMTYSSPPVKAPLNMSPSNLLLDKFRQEMQRCGHYPSNVGGLKSSTTSLSGKSDFLLDEMAERQQQEHVSQDGGGVTRSPRRPQLGLGAVTRQPTSKARVQQTVQRSQSTQAVSALSHQDSAGLETPQKNLVLRPGQTGLRPPGFSALPPARLASFGFVRSSSVSSVSSNQSNESGHSDHTLQHPSSSSDDASPLRTAGSPHGPSHPPPAGLQRRSLPPQRSSPLTSRRDVHKDPEATLPPRQSPKRFAVVSPKPQSPVRGSPTAARTEQAKELDRVVIQQLRQRCEQQDLQLQNLQAQLKKASLCLDVFTITTQHFCHKSESAIVKERELSLELARIRDEVAFSVAHWEQLQQEKEELERRFEAELQGLQAQQQRELGALEERLRGQHAADAKSLKDQQRAELRELRFQHQEQMEEMNENHEVSLMEMESAHNDTLATLQEEHARTVKNLKMAHDQQRKSLEEEFEKIRLSLQDQVDTLTFQNRSLRDRAKRFEEALRKSTDEQIVDALAPYKHIEEDLKSLKEVLEMKNQQIHQQELKITELEKIAEKNVYLEERVQVLQQQNEDLKERIDKNLAVSRQLSEENANLQVNVEKESKEKKRLSRTNEELLWRLQTGELSPRMSPTCSPIHRPASGPGSPTRPHSYHQ
ncbi:microtubule-associated tumor suppressor candidate 2 isoform 2-T2 [Synchiropus picturatus]